MREKRFVPADNDDATRKLFVAVDRCVAAMLRLERKHGHHGVFTAIREWLNVPFRAGPIGWKREAKR